MIAMICCTVTIKSIAVVSNKGGYWLSLSTAKSNRNRNYLVTSQVAMNSTRIERDFSCKDSAMLEECCNFVQVILLKAKIFNNFNLVFFIIIIAGQTEVKTAEKVSLKPCTASS